MHNDAQSANDGEVVFEREITEEEIESLAHPNILVECDRVTLKSIPPWIHTFLLTAFYAIALIFAFHEGLADWSIAGCVLFAVSTPIFLVCLVRQKVTTVFDRLERTVHRRNPLWTMAGIPFEEIAEITMVDDAGAVYFKIAPKANRLGKGVRISRNYDGRSGEFLYMIMRCLPAVSGMLEECQTPGADPATASAMLAEHPVLYSRNGSVYTFTTWRNQCLALVLSAGMLLGFAYLEDWMRWIGLVIGCLAFLAAFVVNNRIVIDAGEKTIRFSDLFGILKTTFSLSRYAGLRIVREYTNGIYTHTTASMEFRDPEVTSDFYWAVRTNTLSALAEETQAIIAAALAGPDNHSE